MEFIFDLLKKLNLASSRFRTNITSMFIDIQGSVWGVVDSITHFPPNLFRPALDLAFVLFNRRLFLRPKFYYFTLTLTIVSEQSCKIYRVIDKCESDYGLS